MQIDLEYLREHYASLSDEALAAIDRSELVEAAQRCYDEEVARREPAPEPDSGSVDEPPDDRAAANAGDDEPLAWLADAACACTFVAPAGHVHASNAAPDAARACDALQAAGIPCHLAVERLNPADSRPVTEYRVLVPGALTLHAVSVLDKEIFNAAQEADWRAHLVELSDEELRALDPDVFCAGLLDRAERLRRAYEDEIGRRKGLTEAAGQSA